MQKNFAKVVTRLDFARESSTFCLNYFTWMTSSYRKLIWCRLLDCFRYGVQPATRETHLFQLRRTRRKHRSVRILPTDSCHNAASADDACPDDALRNHLRQISTRWDTFYLYQQFYCFSHYAWTNKLVFLYYKLLSVSCSIAMRGSHVTKSWERGPHWRARMKSANSRLFRVISTFRRSSIATRRQFGKQSRTRSNNTGTYDSFL